MSDTIIIANIPNHDADVSLEYVTMTDCMNACATLGLHCVARDDDNNGTVPCDDLLGHCDPIINRVQIVGDKAVLHYGKREFYSVYYDYWTSPDNYDYSTSYGFSSLDEAYDHVAKRLSAGEFRRWNVVEHNGHKFPQHSQFTIIHETMDIYGNSVGDDVLLDVRILPAAISDAYHELLSGEKMARRAERKLDKLMQGM